MRFDATATPIWMYADDVMRRLDRNWDGRIETNDPFLSPRTRNFLRQADTNMDRFVDRFELEREISWSVDRNMDRRIDDRERQDAWMFYDLPGRGRDHAPVPYHPARPVPHHPARPVPHHHHHHHHNHPPRRVPAVVIRF